MHPHGNVEVEEETGKPQITQGGFVTLDFCCIVYFPQRKDVYWTLCVLSGMIDITMVNAFIIHCSQ